MIEEENLSRLGLFGLTRQEAIIYITLLSNRFMTGYEISKQTGISKSNTYGSLTSLVNKGAAYVVTEESAKYTSVSLEEFCKNRIRLMEATKKELAENLTFTGPEAEGYITISGRNHIDNKLRNMLEGARSRIYLSLDKELLGCYQEELQDLIRRNIKVVLITDSRPDLPGATIHYAREVKHQIRIIVDSIEVLTGEPEKNCLYSKNENLVTVFKDMLTNEIEIIKMKGE